MLKRLVSTYKISLFVSITVFAALLALTLERDPIQIALIFLGCLLGTFILDLDYLLQAYFLETDSDFSKDVQTYIKHRDIKGVIEYIHFHKNELKDKTLNSALFQVVLAGVLLIVTSSNTNQLVKALVVSTFANSLYKMAEAHFENNLNSWFWAFKNKPNKLAFQLYVLTLLGILFLALNFYN